MAIVSTGQVTIYDHNDAVSIAAYITASEGLSQTKSVSDGESYAPDYTSDNNTLTAAVYVGASNVVSLLTSKQWYLDGIEAGDAISGETDTTFVVDDNQNPDTASQRTYYFQGDYTDPVTNLVTHILAQVALIAVKTGTNAVFIQVRGQTIIEKSSSSTKNTANVWAEVMRGATIDITGIKYKWFKYPYGSGDELYADHEDITPNVYIKFVATADVNDGDWSSYASAPSDWADVQGIEINQEAVDSLQLYKVQATGDDGSTVLAEAIFQITDMSDPYSVVLASSNGNIFQNSGGSTKVLTPTVYYGGAQVTLDSSYKFDYELIDRLGAKSGFINTIKTPAPKTITSHTTGSVAVFTLVGVFDTPPVAGDVVRVISADKTIVRSYEISACSNSTNATVTIREPQNGFDATSVGAGEFTAGTLSVYVGNGATAGKRLDVEYNATCAVLADDIDGMGQILVTVNH